LVGVGLSGFRERDESDTQGNLFDGERPPDPADVLDAP
jgi:hypothetical protein